MWDNLWIFVHLPDSFNIYAWLAQIIHPKIHSLIFIWLKKHIKEYMAFWIYFLLYFSYLGPFIVQLLTENIPGLPLYTIRNHFLFDFKWSDRSKICNRGIRRQFCRKMKCIVTSTYLCIKWDRIGMLNDTHAVITQCSCYSFMCMISQKKSTG